MNKNLNDNFCMSPKIDFAFKELMQVETIRNSFLKTVLKEDIVTSKIENPFLSKKGPDDKLGILDVRVLLNSSLEVDLEIQIASFKQWNNRSLFYLFKMFCDEIEAGNKNYKTDKKKFISISILDFILLNESKNFYSCFHLREDNSQMLFSDVIELHVIELPKIKKCNSSNNNLLLWAMFFNSTRREEFEMLAKKDDGLKTAYEKLDEISHDKEKRMAYLEREKALRDRNSLIEQGRDEILELVTKLKTEGKSSDEIVDIISSECRKK